MGAVAAGRVLTAHLDDLTPRDRENTSGRALEFIGLEDPGPMRRYFAGAISAERAHVGKWRERMAPRDARMIDRRYRRFFKRLRKDDVDWIPEPK